MAERDQSFNATPTTTTGTTTPHSPWHSPVPYLFGGLAAMLGLIAFALLILACSYWKLSGYLDNNGETGEGGERDLEAGEGKGDDDEARKMGAGVMEQKFLVIMAGQFKPTFLATPIIMSNSTNKSSAFGENNERCCCGDEKGEKLKKQVSSSSTSTDGDGDGDHNQMQSETPETQQSSNQNNQN